jgi:hypothetical protein
MLFWELTVVCCENLQCVEKLKGLLVCTVTTTLERVTADGYNGLVRTKCKLVPKTSYISVHDLHRV